MYYLASSRHPALGYVDYPPITPMLARFDTLVFGTALWSLRLLPILAGTAIVIVAAMIARDLGGGPRAQSVAAFCILVSGIYLGGTWVFETVAFDMLMWAITILLLVRLLRTGDPRWWIPIGVSFGIGLETKYTILALGLGVAVGLILTSERRQLTTPWPWIAALIAAAILAPNLIWQVQHGWPSVSYLTSHHGRIAQETSRGQFVLEQLVLVNLFLLPIVVAGMVWLFRQRQFRLLAWIPIAVEAAFLVAGGKSYYATPVFVLLYAGGSVGLEPYLSEGRRLLRRAAVVVPAALLAVVLLPIALPVLPATTMAKLNLYKVRTDYGDMIGWPEFVRTVARVYDSLPPAERAHTGILVGNYGEAGAIDLYGPRYHLPQALSGHLTYYYWKPAHVVVRALILVEVTPSSLEGQCRSTRRVATVTNSLGVRNEEYGNPVVLCQGHINLDKVWPRQLHYD
jgi:4-amino-4-deoxy-L-arabinose transferase-like glycosyltransferase